LFEWVLLLGGDDSGLCCFIDVDDVDAVGDGAIVTFAGAVTVEVKLGVGVGAVDVGVGVDDSGGGALLVS